MYRPPSALRPLPQVAVLLYGFPPGVGAVGTAALLNVPRSLELVLKELQDAGYDLGEAAADLDGEAIVTALKYEGRRLASAGGATVCARFCRKGQGMCSVHEPQQ